jgi:hypothetical protein
VDCVLRRLAASQPRCLDNGLRLKGSAHHPDRLKHVRRTEPTLAIRDRSNTACSLSQAGDVAEEAEE